VNGDFIAEDAAGLNIDIDHHSIKCLELSPTSRYSIFLPSYPLAYFLVLFLNFANMSDETAESQTQVGNNEKSLNDWPKNIVDWDGPDDPKNPMNWSRKKKLGITVLLGLVTMGSSFASSSFSPTFDAVSMEFGVSTEVVTLSLSLYVLGFAFGPLVSPSFLHPQFVILGLLF